MDGQGLLQRFSVSAGGALNTVHAQQTFAATTTPPSVPYIRVKGTHTLKAGAEKFTASYQKAEKVYAAQT